MQRVSSYRDMVSNLSSQVENGSDDDSFMSFFSQQLLNQDLMKRQDMVLSQICRLLEEIQDLRQENVNLKMTNLELRNRLNLFVDKANQIVVPSLSNGSCKINVNEVNAESFITSYVMDLGSSRIGRGSLERVCLPKSISVRSRGYVKGSETGSSSSTGSGSNYAGTQKVYIGAGKEQPLELEMYNQGMIKTELCNNWQQTGTCAYGSKCQYAHGIEELRPVVRHPRYKTEVCRMVLNGVSCPYGHRCHFRHALTENEKLGKSMSSTSNTMRRQNSTKTDIECGTGHWPSLTYNKT